MSTLNLFTFNNYYNRIIVRYNTLDEYIENGTLLYSYQDRNFNPNDGVSTTAIFNYRGTQPDYCVITDAYNNIESRWWVIEAVRTREGQYMVTLYRDLVSEYYSQVLTAPAFIEKAMLNKDDPLIFNSENMTYNQIRTSQTLLADKSDCPWIVGYIPHNALAETTELEVDTIPQAEASAIKVEGLSNWAFYNYTDVGGRRKGKINSSGVTFKARLVTDRAGGVLGGARYETLEYNITVPSEGHTYGSGTLLTTPGTNERKYTPEAVIASNQNGQDLPIYGIFVQYFTGETGKFSSEACAQVLAQQVANSNNYTNRVQEEAFAVSSANRIDTYSGKSDLEQFSGKLLLDTVSGKYYKIALKKETVTYSDDASESLISAIRASTNSLTSQELTGYTNQAYMAIEPWWAPLNAASKISVTANLEVQYLQLVSVDTRVRTALPSKNIRPHPIDAPYDMFCMPYGDITCIGSTGGEFVNEKQVALSIATALPEKLGADAVYDLQLLPYCPVPYALTDDGKFDLRYGYHTEIYNTVDPDVGLRRGAIFWCTATSFNNSIDVSVPAADTALQRKINNETVFYRLCSPNGSGQFEMSAEKNNGINAFEVFCTYKPYQPFIQVKPVFGGLYGIASDYDYRGLICGGDFSLAQLSNAWANYQLANKNYQEIFNRDIQSLDLKNNVSRSKEALGIITTTASGIGNIAESGMTQGVGGALKAGGQTLGAIALQAVENEMSERLRRDTINYKVDQFGYTLGNIQALPSSITKTAANVISNPLIPYLEKYECTDREINALTEKIKYNGMTVNVIGEIDDYRLEDDVSYIKAKLIRLEDIADDYHIVNALASELDKGVFI